MSGRLKVGLFIGFMVIMVPGLFAFFSWYLGMFETVFHKKMTVPPATFIYTEYRGDYRKAGKSLGTVVKFLDGYNIPCRPLMIYFDDDKKVIKKQLRSQVGCMVEKKPDRLTDQVKVRQLAGVSGEAFFTHAHPSIAIKKVTDRMREFFENKQQKLKFPLLSFPLEGAIYFIIADNINY